MHKSSISAVYLTLRTVILSYSDHLSSYLGRIRESDLAVTEVEVNIEVFDEDVT